MAASVDWVKPAKSLDDIYVLWYKSLAVKDI